MNFIIKIIVDQILSRLFDWLGKVIANHQRNRAIKDAADASVKPLIDAKTPEEIKDATKDALDNI